MKKIYLFILCLLFMSGCVTIKNMMLKSTAEQIIRTDEIFYSPSPLGSQAEENYKEKMNQISNTVELKKSIKF